jgi:hypothetical protein
MPTLIDHDWIISGLEKGLAVDRTLAAQFRARAESPPDPSLAVVYGQLATAEDRFYSILETNATRHGHTPTHSRGGGLGESFGWLRSKVPELGSSPFDRLTDDRVARATPVLWCMACVHAFEAIGDAESARELMAVLAETRSHCESLRGVLNRLDVERLNGTDVAAPAADVPCAAGTT